LRRTVPREALESWGLTGSATLLGDQVNRVWRVGGAIVRLSTRGSVRSIEAELDFIRHVGTTVDVALPRATLEGRWTRACAEGVVAVFEIAPGSTPSVEPVFARAWGVHVARLHAAARGWTGARDLWHAHPWWNPALVPCSDGALRTVVERTVASMMDVEVHPCHADQGPQNVHWDGQTVTSFDFDNLVFQPLSLDLAVPWSILEGHPAACAAFDNGYGWSPSNAERATWIGRRRVFVLLSRLALWPEPTATQATFVSGLRDKVLASFAR
jgi:Ser/Thr protein kinase RdoA (MazF antagonist)